MDIAERSIEQNKLDQLPWFDREAFLSGTLAPDLGYMDEGEIAFTRLAHSNKSRKIIKKLFKYSETRDEISFSAGFLLHTIADKIIERLIDWYAGKIRRRPWYMIKIPSWYEKNFLHGLHHQRIEWSLDLDLFEAGRGWKLSKYNILLPQWHKVNPLSRAYKKIFNLEINYKNIAEAINKLESHKPRIFKAITATGLTKVLGKRYYPFKKMRYHILRRFGLLMGNFDSLPVHVWTVLDPEKLNKRQRQSFDNLKNKVLNVFAKNIRHNKMILNKPL